MSELMQFRVARAPQRVIPESFSLLRLNHGQTIASWIAAENLSSLLGEYLKEKNLAPPAILFTINNDPELSVLLKKIRNIDSFLSYHGNRPSPESLIAEVPKLLGCNFKELAASSEQEPGVAEAGIKVFTSEADYQSVVGNQLLFLSFDGRPPGDLQLLKDGNDFSPEITFNSPEAIDPTNVSWAPGKGVTPGDSITDAGSKTWPFDVGPLGGEFNHPTKAFGFLLSSISTRQTVELYDVNDALIASVFTAVPSGTVTTPSGQIAAAPVFFGVVSETPIKRFIIRNGVNAGYRDRFFVDDFRIHESKPIPLPADSFLKLRCNISYALVASILGTVELPLRVDLTRLMLVMGLLELLANSDRLKTADDIYWALRWRTIVFPQQFLDKARVQKSILARRAGFSDLFVVRDEWNRYEAGEIAHIENVLAKESKERKHVRIDETEETFLTETEKSTTNERDSQTTNRFELSNEASQDINLAAHIEGKVDTSGQYGPTHVDTHLGGSLDYSTEQSERRATKQAQETVARAVTRVEEKVREMRTKRTLTRIEETNIHGIKNDTDKPIVGIYRWVDKVQRMQMFRYPNRYLLEFEVPEPGAYRRWLDKIGKNKGIISIEPLPITIDGNAESDTNKRLTAADILTEDEAAATPNKPSYLEIAARYFTSGLKQPPVEKITVSATLKQEASNPADDTSPTHFYELSQEKSIRVPDGYMATKFKASIMSWTHWSWPAPAWAKDHESVFKTGTLKICIGAEHEKYTVSTEASELDQMFERDLLGDDRYTSTLPLSVVTDAMRGFTIDILLNCQRRSEALEKWRQETYDQIVSAYWDMKRQYDEEVAAKTVRQGVLINGDSPTRNKEVIQDELKKQVIEMLIGSDFKGKDYLPDEHKSSDEPEIDLNKAQKIAPEIQFLEQAFEWENMTYVLYPYFWAGHAKWSDLADINGTDPEFARFLRSGSARVVLPARPGFEAQVQLYTDFGVFWGGGPVPAPGEEGYLSVAEEIKAQTQPPKDGIPGESWEVRLPTSLIWLENPAELPKNPAPKLAPPPGEKQCCICYVIKPGDTLSALALRFYGNADEYMKIFEANRDVIGDDSDKIYAGQVIAIPR